MKNNKTINRIIKNNNQSFELTTPQQNRIYRRPDNEYQKTPDSYEIYIYDDIGSPSEYIEEIALLGDLESGDDVYIRLATGGGRIDGAIALIHALLYCKAKTIAVADSDVGSAGTLLFFACGEMHIKPFSTMMFHVASSMIGGKISESAKQISSTLKLVEKLMRNLYIPYLTDDEVDGLMSGIDLYLDSDEVQERLIANGCGIEEND